MTICQEVEVRVLPVSVLVAMKQEAGRPRDLDDVAHLLALHPTSEDTDE